MIPWCYHTLKISNHNIPTFEQVNKIDLFDFWVLNRQQTNYSPAEVRWVFASLYVASWETNMSKVGEISISVFQTPTIPEGEVGREPNVLHFACIVLEQCLLRVGFEC